MLSKYHKNTVMHGCLDYFCLACENHLRTEEDVNLHIEKPVHKKNLGLAQYVDSCAQDWIRKVNKRYYCECCNVLLATMTKVSLHIKEAKHEFNRTDESGGTKRSAFLKWMKNSVVALEDLVIGEKAWHGFVGETCVICETEFDDAALHRSEVGHLLRVVQAKVQLGSDNFISRKIDETTYQCLTCNTVLTHGDMMTHYDQPEHTKLYLECRKVKRALMTTEPKDEKKTEPKKKEEPKVEEPKTVEATDKKETKKPAKKEAEKKPAEVIPTRGDEEISPYDRDVNKVLGTNEYLKFVPGSSTVLCLLCDWSIDVLSISQHINGHHHRTLLKMQEAKAEEMKKGKKATKKEVSKEKKEETPVAVKAPVAVEADEANKSKIIDSIQSFQKDNILIDLISEKAFCKRCSNNVNYVFEDIEEHIEAHKKSNTQNKTNGEKYPTMDKSLNKTEVKRPEPEKPKLAAEETKLVVEDVETFAKNNEITYNKTHNKAYCRLCETKVPSTLKCLQEHVQGNNHQLKKNKPKEKVVLKNEDREDALYKTKSVEDFIDTFITIENIFRHDCVINDEICVNVLSFLTMTRISPGRMRCQVCEKTLEGSEINEHKEEKRHERLMNTAKVVYTLDDEFVREVRPDVFHCGFCNLIEAGWANLQHHLCSSSHRDNKHGCEWMLQEHRPAIRAHQARKQQAEFLFIMRMLMGRSF